MKKIIIIGAGPAGLTAAYELLKLNKYDITILEESSSIGGLSKNIYWGENIIDPGGHRFFSKDEIVNKIWQKFMFLQSKPSFEEKEIGWSTKLTNEKLGKDPEKDDDVLLMRTRMSRIYFNNSFFDYPLSINFKTIKNLGFIKTFKAGCSYLFSRIYKRKEINLENFYINRFGKYLYSIFFEGYTEKLWGRHPREIDASWGKQRVKGLSLSKAVINAIIRPFIKDNQKVEGSLVGSFSYPKYGPGQLYEIMANYLNNHGVKIIKNKKVVKIDIKNKNVKKVICNDDSKYELDILFSSMPLKDLILSIDDKDLFNDIRTIAKDLPYRDFITVNVLLNDLKIHNKTKIKTFNNRIPDTWLYVQDSKVKLGRIQILNNWSPYLTKDNNKTMIGLEFFANEGDSFWNKTSKEIVNFALTLKGSLKVKYIEAVFNSSSKTIEKKLFVSLVNHIIKNINLYMDNEEFKLETIRGFNTNEISVKNRIKFKRDSISLYINKIMFVNNNERETKILYSEYLYKLLLVTGKLEFNDMADIVLIFAAWKNNLCLVSKDITPEKFIHFINLLNSKQNDIYDLFLKQ